MGTYWASSLDLRQGCLKKSVYSVHPIKPTDAGTCYEFGKSFLFVKEVLINTSSPFRELTH